MARIESSIGQRRSGLQWRRPGLLLALLLLSTSSGCDRNIEPYQPGEVPRKPDLSRIFPPEEGSRPTPARAASPSIRGTISIARRSEAGLRPGGFLFILTRPAGTTSGPPIAVVRLEATGFPIDFEIGPQHVMMDGAAFAGEMSLTARLDYDGNASTRQPGDLEGMAGAAVRPGDQGVRVVLGGSPGPAPAAGQASVAPGPAPITGQVALAAELAGSDPGPGVLFIIARPGGARGGPPLAVQRIDSPRFPQSFSIGPDQVMIPSMRFAAPIDLTARLDRDGNAMTREVANLSAPRIEGLAPGRSEVLLELRAQ